MERDHSIKTEPVWMLEDYSIPREMKKEPKPLTFQTIENDDMSSNPVNEECSAYTPTTVKEEEPRGFEENDEEVKPEIDIEEHNILEVSSECSLYCNGGGNLNCKEFGTEQEKNIEECEQPASIMRAKQLKKKPYKCDLCSKRFEFHSKIVQHMRIHTWEKPFICEVCQKYFTTSRHLIVHLKTPSAKHPFKCEVCQKCLTSISNLNVHMRIHTGEKPFECEVCQKCLASYRNLEGHMRIHTGEKPFRCEVCQKYFRTSSCRNVHMKTHTGVGLFH